MEIKNCLLESDEYYSEVYEKDTVFIHHTAGSHRPDWSVACWEHDRTKSGLSLKVATAYVIGGISTRDPKDTAWDGVIVRAFDDKFWAHHLGTKESNNSKRQRHGTLSNRIQSTNCYHAYQWSRMLRAIQRNFTTNLPIGYRYAE
jgi:hypothetical protein